MKEKKFCLCLLFLNEKLRRKKTLYLKPSFVFMTSFVSLFSNDSLKIFDIKAINLNIKQYHNHSLYILKLALKFNW